MRVIKQIKAIRLKIGSFGHIIKQDGQKSLHMTKDKVFFANIYMVVDGSRELIRQTKESKDLDMTIGAALLSLATAGEWTKGKDTRSIEADITVKWWKHNCESKSGGISKENKKPKEHILTTVDSKEEHLPTFPKIANEKNRPTDHDKRM